MNLLMYAINEIHHQIPNEILQAGFMIDEQPSTINLTSLDDKIVRKLFKKRVLIDANIIGGVELIVPIGSTQPNYVEDFYTVYVIPPELTMNREIISALGLAYSPYYGSLSNGVPLSNFPAMSSNNCGGFNPINSVADRIGSSSSPSGTLTNAHIEIVAYNTLLIYAHYRTLMNYGVRVVVENDSNLNNIQPRSYKSFSMMCVLAAKAYLYNKLIIPINSGYLASGQELGMFKNILDNYSSAEEEYRIYLKEIWGAVAYTNDVTRYNRFLRSMLIPDL